MAQDVNIAELIDSRPIGTFQAGAIALCAAIVLAEGFDTHAIAFAAPDISSQWGLGPGALGTVFAAGLCGVMLGSLLLAPLADRIGRRRVILAATFAFALLTLATAHAWDIASLLTLRFLTGLGLGAAMPNAIALTAELSPARRRAFLVMIMFGGFSLGSAGGGFAAAYLIPRFGWESVFYLGGLAPLLALPLIAWALPESPSFLALRNGTGEEARRLLRKLAPDIGADANIFVAEPPLTRGALSELFSPGRARTTILLWIIFFMSLLDLYLISQWLPMTLTASGASIQRAAITGSIFQLGGLIGTFVLGLLSDRFGRARILATAYLCAAASILAVVFVDAATLTALAAVAGAGFGVVGGQIAANALAAHKYPTAIRSTGVGWALGIGRIGSIVGPLVGGLLLSLNISAQTLLGLSIVPVCIACAAALAIARSEG